MEPGQRPGGPTPTAPDPRGHRVAVEIYGEQYTLRGDADEGYMHDLARRLDQRMRELAARRPQLTATQLAVLTALNTLDDLVRLESQYHRALALFEREWERRRQEGGALPPAGGEQPKAGTAGPVSWLPSPREGGLRDGVRARPWSSDAAGGQGGAGGR
jgi:cell division protein ZapA